MQWLHIDDGPFCSDNLFLLSVSLSLPNIASHWLVHDFGANGSKITGRAKDKWRMYWYLSWALASQSSSNIDKWDFQLLKQKWWNSISVYCWMQDKVSNCDSCCLQSPIRTEVETSHKSANSSVLASLFPLRQPLHPISAQFLTKASPADTTLSGKFWCQQKHGRQRPKLGYNLISIHATFSICWLWWHSICTWCVHFQIRSMAGLTTLGSNSHLQELYVASNKITKIEGLESFVHIKILELGSNRISKVEGLNQLMSLEQLWMGRNRVEKIENIGHLTRLRQLSLQSNRLECMAGLEQCLSLEEVYLSHNGITRMEVRFCSARAVSYSNPCQCFPGALMGEHQKGKSFKYLCFPFLCSIEM